MYFHSTSFLKDTGLFQYLDNSGEIDLVRMKRVIVLL